MTAPTLLTEHPPFIKSFFADSIREAMEQASLELGPDAMLLNSRQSPPESRNSGEFEVVFGVGSSEPPAATPPPAPAGIIDVDRLRSRLEQSGEPAGRAKPSPGAFRAHDIAISQALVDAGVETHLARDIENSVRERMSKGAVLKIGRPRLPYVWDFESLASETLAELSCRFEVAPQVGRITALVGPPGAGKTTSLVKLAITQGLAAGRSVRLVSTDTQRIGGAEQLEIYASILDVPFEAVDGIEALAHAIDSAPTEALLLIDTPGYSAAALQSGGAEMAAFFARRQDIDTHLVLTASMRSEDISSAAGRFAAFAPSKLLFTKLDETASVGAMFTEAARQRRPLSFFCNGQQVPEGLEPARKQHITAALLAHLPATAKAVA